MPTRRLFAGLICSVLVVGCTTAVYAPQIQPPSEIPVPGSIHDNKLKVHLKSGELLVLDSWAQSDSVLTGQGTLYDLWRERVREGEFVLPLESIALLESEVREGSRRTAVAGMAVWTTIYGIITAACVADPKSCFGSCPTFYVPTDSGEVLAAEGFSASIARALEAKDLDALFPARPTGGAFTIRMRNEALETQAIRSVMLLAAPRPADGRVFASADGRFYPVTGLRPPLDCRADEGDCLAALLAPDGSERTSPADSIDLATTEMVELAFPSGTGRLGFVLAARQSLMSTYLFYQTMGFFGTKAGEFMATLERGGPEAARRSMAMSQRIGRIRVEVLEDDGWTPIGEHEEAGPIATQVEVMPFTHHTPGPVRVRLMASKGSWRLDWTALGILGRPVDAITLSPEAVLGDGGPDSTALAALRDPDAHLITYPGDSYEVMFRLPPLPGGWDVFLQSEGYYYEWMRSDWLIDENPELAAMVIADPNAALRVLAPGFKRAEPQMEKLFWSSRFAR